MIFLLVIKYSCFNKWIKVKAFEIALFFILLLLDVDLAISIPIDFWLIEYIPAWCAALVKGMAWYIEDSSTAKWYEVDEVLLELCK